ncbi:MAG TPA: UvrD-helicase domain-containing protein [Pirellulales bacterium]|jgi:DNA helicase-2/ATP-dependent DNA helicase PcrA|nr:UvrD-helicase domain-containing protein [Pirellulales bacterium]
MSIEQLTEAQLAAVRHVDGPLLILAGPGSGKTRVVTHRIANLLELGVPARHILALTFTNKAADEMKRRVALLAPLAAVWMSTFHRFCAQLLREYAPYIGLPENYTIYDTSDSLQALRHTLDALDLDLTHTTPERVQSAMSWAKNNLITPEQYEPRKGSPVGAIVARVYPEYQKRLLASGAVDFDDLLLHTAVLLRENPEIRRRLDDRYRYILVDEYQDTNLAQYTIVRAMSVDYPNLAVTGDPDQSIYGWRGANLSNILDFEHDYPNVKIVRLEQNYRSTKRILRVADRLISFNKRRKLKTLFTDNAEGRAVQLIFHPTQKDEAEQIAGTIEAEVRSGRRRPRDFAIFYRTNALSRALEFALREYGIPYQMINGLEFYQRKEIKDVLAYLHLLNNPRDNVAFARIINTPPRGIGRGTIGRLQDYAATRGFSLLSAAREAGLIEGLNKRAAVGVAKFVALFDHVTLAAGAPVEEIIGRVLADSGYHDFLKESEDEDDQERLANIEELLTAAREFDETHPGPGALEAFLEQAALVNDTDAWEVDDDRVTLMTVHAAKGLEFPVVFIIALEEGIFPHERSRNEEEQLEEERRLLFVGVTRAKEELYLNRACYRHYRGQFRPTVPSAFLMELPQEELDFQQPQTAPLPEPAFSDLHAEDQHGDDAIDFDPHDLEFPSPPSEAGQVAASLSAGADNSSLSLPLEEGRGEGAVSAPPFRFTTAAELAARSASAAPGQAAPSLPSISPEVFHQGMVVRHPHYGLGKIVALSGSGLKRKATVMFASSAGEKRFLLAHSPLCPASL